MIRKHWNLLAGAACAAVVVVGGVVDSARAGTIVPDLNDGDAIFSSATPVATTATTANNANGVTLAASLTPDATDITNSATGPTGGTVNIIEIGGTANGAAIMISDGQYLFTTNFENNGSGGGARGSSADDTDGADGIISVFLGDAVAGESAEVWASFDASADVVRFGLNGTLNEVALTNVADNWNWSGNDTLSIADIDPTNGSRGGLFDIGDYASAPFPDNFAAAASSTLSGSFTLGQYFNDVSAVPEPASLALVGLGGLCLIARRKK